jgi:hypothetical protein
LRNVTRVRLRTENLSWRTLDGEVIALDAQASAYLGANVAGSLLWRRLADGATRDELVAELVDAYGIDRSTAEADVDRFIVELSQAGLLEELPSAPA